MNQYLPDWQPSSDASLLNRATAFQKSCHSIGTKKDPALYAAVTNLLIPLVNSGWNEAREPADKNQQVPLILTR